MSFDWRTASADELVWFTDEYLDKTLERLDSALNPVLKASVKAGETVLWLSTGALVLSMSLTQFLISQDVTLEWGFLLPVAWCFFVLCIILIAHRHGRLTNIRSARIRFEQQREAIRKEIRSLDRDHSFPEKYDSVLKSALSSAWEDPQKAIKVYDTLGKVMGWCFVLALLLLVIFTVRNFPF